MAGCMAGDCPRVFRSGEGATAGDSSLTGGVSVGVAAFVFALPPIMPSLVGFLVLAGDAMVGV